MDLRKVTMQVDGGLIVAARTPHEILRTFFPFAPLRIYATHALSAIAGTALLFLLLRQVISDEAALQWAALGGFVGGGIVTWVTAVEWCCRLADCKFEIKNQMLEIRAPTMTRILSAVWPVSMVQEFVMESQPTLWEEIASERYYGASEILGGAERPEKTLRILTIDGGLTEFRMMNRVFDRRAINAIVNELAQRGVKISRVTKNAE